MNANLSYFSEGIQTPAKKGGCHGIEKELIKDVSLKSSHPCDNG